MEENNISGWSSYEIEIEGQNEKYYGFQVTGRCGDLDEPKEEGFYTGCTEKAMKLLEENKITNTELEDIETVEAPMVLNWRHGKKIYMLLLGIR